MAEERRCRRSARRSSAPASRNRCWPRRRAPAGPFTLPRLPYANDALDAAIDARTMEIHHDRHHQAYVDNLNTAVAGNADLARMPIEEILRDIARFPKPSARRSSTTAAATTTIRCSGRSWAPTPAAIRPARWLKRSTPPSRTSTLQDAVQGSRLRVRFGSGWAWLV